MIIGVAISLAGAYLLGSIPTGVWLSKGVYGIDIRKFGDGNTGARNVNHVLGWKASIIVAASDFLKGASAILLARLLKMDMMWQVLAGFSAVIGHDFPIFAEFKGGQGMATSLGTMSILFPMEAIIGLLIFGLVYLIVRHFDLSAGIGLGSIAAMIWFNHQPDVFIFYLVAVFLSIPLKKFIDSYYRIPEKAKEHAKDD